MSKRLAVFCTLALVVTMLQGAYSVPASAAELTTLVSQSADGVANQASDAPSISADGRYVAFESYADNLVPDDTNGTQDIFVWDREGDGIVRVSVDSSGQQADSFSEYPSISANGRYVVFQSRADNLVPDDTNGVGDIFVHDLQTGTTVRASVANDGSESSGESDSAFISGDGRYVAFVNSSQLDPNTLPGKDNVYVRDLVSGTTQLMSVGHDGSPGDSHSEPIGLSADGSRVLFMSLADNLIVGDDNGHSDYFVADVATGATQIVSVSTSGAQGDQNVSDNEDGASISADGRYVAFETSASLAPSPPGNQSDVFLRDLQMGTTTRVVLEAPGLNTGGPTGDGVRISGDGNVIVCVGFALTPHSGVQAELYAIDLSAGTTELVTASPDGDFGNQPSTYGWGLDQSGRYIAFGSSATNLVPGPAPAVAGVYLRDRDAPAIAPDAPTGVLAAAGDGQASVSWTPPASDGGSPINGYTVTSSPDGLTQTVDASTVSANFTGLTNGTPYTFTVVATNGVGPGGVSAPSAPVTPQAGAPDPVIASGTATDTGGGSATTDPGSGPTADQPVTSTVQVPPGAGGGDITVAQGTVSDQLSGWQFGGEQIHIDSTAATTAANPLVLTFVIDGSMLDGTNPASPLIGETPQSLQIFRTEGSGTPALVPDCASDPTSVAAPDPCIPPSSRAYVNGTDASFTVVTSQASDWNFGATTPVKATVANAGCKPKALAVARGQRAEWTFSGKKLHSVTDQIGLGPADHPLFDSGPRKTGSFFVDLSAAGIYKYKSTVKGDGATFACTLSVPMGVSPATGHKGGNFTVTWSSTPLAGYVFDVQDRFKKAGTSKWGAWTAWETGVTQPSATFTPAAAGAYDFRALMRNASTGRATAFSAVLLLSVKT